MDMVSNMPIVNDRYRVKRSVGRGGMAEVFWPTIFCLIGLLH